MWWTDLANPFILCFRLGKDDGMIADAIEKAHLDEEINDFGNLESLFDLFNRFE